MDPEHHTWTPLPNLILANHSHWRIVEMPVIRFQCSETSRLRSQADYLLAQVALFQATHVIIHHVSNEHFLSTYYVPGLFLDSEAHCCL